MCLFWGRGSATRASLPACLLHVLSLLTHCVSRWRGSRERWTTWSARAHWLTRRGWWSRTRGRKSTRTVRRLGLPCWSGISICCFRFWLMWMWLCDRVWQMGCCCFFILIFYHFLFALLCNFDHFQNHEFDLFPSLELTCVDVSAGACICTTYFSRKYGQIPNWRVFRS